MGVVQNRVPLLRAKLRVDRPVRARVKGRKCKGRLATLLGAERVTHLARPHGTSRKFVRAQRERAGHALELAFAEPSAPSRVEPLPRMSDAWVRHFVLGGVLIVHGSYRQVVELLRVPVWRVAER